MDRKMQWSIPGNTWVQQQQNIAIGPKHTIPGSPHPINLMCQARHNGGRFPNAMFG